MMLSVIVPALDEEETLPLAVASVGTRDGAEVIVVDGGSADGTARIARTIADRVVSAPAGRAAQMNAGAAAARGDLLLFLHADARLGAGALEAVRAAVARGARAGAFRLGIDSPRRVFRWIERGVDLRSCLLGLPYGDQAIWVRRDLFDEVGGYAPIPFLEDLDLVLRLRRRTRLAILDPPVSTSARRWDRHGVGRTTLANLTVAAAYILGGDAARLARLHHRLLGRRDVRLLVFARPPVAGGVKRRLAASVGEARALEVYRACLDRALAAAAAAGLETVVVAAEGPVEALRPHLPPGVPIRPQAPGDLGARLAAALAEAFADGAEGAIAIGSDCPGVEGRHIVVAAEALGTGAGAVVGPAEDGGYWLVGLARAAWPRGRGLFEGIPWSTGLVLDATRARAAALSIALAEVETLRDIDFASDLADEGARVAGAS